MLESEFWAMFGSPVAAPAPRHLPPPPQLLVQQPQPQPQGYPVVWTRAEDKVFESSLVRFPEGAPDRWLHIAAQLPGKRLRDVVEHYRALLQDVLDIDAGRISPPDYDGDGEEDDGLMSADSDSSAAARRRISFGSKAKEERKKGVPWTEEEHRRFLEGLERYGKGDWRSISRNAVVTRTPTQVASHAQKYFIRLNSMGKKEKKRGSIHDITKP